MARPLGFPVGEPSVIGGPRVVAASGGAISADPTSLTDANFPIASDPAKGGILRCSSMKTIWIGVKMADGTKLPAGSTVTVEPLVLDEMAATDNHWDRLLDASGNPYSVTLSNAGYKELVVAGRTVFLRISAVGGTSIAGDIVLTAFQGETYLP